MINTVVRALFFSIIALQAADALFTFWAIGTGQAEEKNFLLAAIAHHSVVNVLWVVVAAKLVVAVLFALAVNNGKATRLTIASMLGVIAFYCYVVVGNIALYLSYV